MALAGCSVLIGALGYVPGASAHIGASHAPFNTDRPDLLTASIVGTNVVACFDVSLDSVDTSPGSHDPQLHAYDTYEDHNFELDSSTAVIQASNDKCVQYDASDDPSLDQRRIFSVTAETVSDGSLDNSQGAVALTGGVAAADMHETDAPELLTVA
ncbi:MAG: hypothetical protein ACRDPR_19515, partial [Nocardioidaceae bacterium]